MTSRRKAIPVNRVTSFVVTRNPIRAVALTASFILLASCTKLSQANKFFFSSCPSDGPTQEQDFEIRYLPFDLDAYYASLQAANDYFSVTERARIAYQTKSYPIYHIQPRAQPQKSHTKPTLLIIAGIHGNEQAALLAIPRVMNKLQHVDSTSLAWNFSFMVPVNPVGATHHSRYNGQGCDINRDFGRFETAEAQLIRTLIDEIKPDLVLAPHEGPQSGFFIIATAATDHALARELLNDVTAQKITLANENFLGLGLSTPGLSQEGKPMATLKQLIGLGSLGTYLDAQQTGTITTESAWGSDNEEERINSHVVAILSLLTINTAR